MLKSITQILKSMTDFRISGFSIEISDLGIKIHDIAVNHQSKNIGKDPLKMKKLERRWVWKRAIFGLYASLPVCLRYPLVVESPISCSYSWMRWWDYQYSDYYPLTDGYWLIATERHKKRDWMQLRRLIEQKQLNPFLSKTVVGGNWLNAITIGKVYYSWEWPVLRKCFVAKQLDLHWKLPNFNVKHQCLQK